MKESDSDNSFEKTVNIFGIIGAVLGAIIGFVGAGISGAIAGIILGGIAGGLFYLVFRAVFVILTQPAFWIMVGILLTIVLIMVLWNVGRP